MAESKEGLQRGTSPEPARGGPSKGHTDVPQAETQVNEAPSESNEDKPENQLSTIDADIEVVGVADGQVFVRFGEGDEQREGRVPLDQFQGDPNPGKRKVTMTNQAYTQMVVSADPSVMEPVRYRFADSDEVEENPPVDEAEEVARRQADRQAEIDNQKADKSEDEGSEKRVSGDTEKSPDRASVPKRL